MKIFIGGFSTFYRHNGQKHLPTLCRITLFRLWIYVGSDSNGFQWRFFLLRWLLIIASFFFFFFLFKNRTRLRFCSRAFLRLLTASVLKYHASHAIFLKESLFDPGVALCTLTKRNWLTCRSLAIMVRK